MLDWLDRLLNRITMYRLVLYCLLGLQAVAAGLAVFGFIGFTWWTLWLTALLMMAVAWATNRIFAWAYDVPAHDDSAYVTALILSLIIDPIHNPTGSIALILWAPVLAMAGKYIFAVRRQHLMNPAALAIALTALSIHQSASWWVGIPSMLPAVLVATVLIVRKIQRGQVVSVFLLVTLLTTIVLGLTQGAHVAILVKRLILSSPLLFFATVMLTEPFTMPPTKKLRLLFAALVGLLFAPQIHFGSVYYTPELALISGNLVFAMFVDRERYILTLRKKVVLSPSITEFIFSAVRKPKFQAGQYLELTVPHGHPDGRGLRRYFTVASSPTEANVHFGIKFYSPASSFKKAFQQLQPGQQIFAGQRDGDFTLPRRLDQPLVFIAGGIGVTPFRSMIQYLLNKKQRRPITLLFANQGQEDIVYSDIFEQARAELGLKTVYILTDAAKVPADWSGQRGFITPQMIQAEVPAYQQATYYISGPQAMVKNYVKVLKRLGLPNRQIKTDYFPGFA